MTEQELKECIAEVKNSAIPESSKGKIINALYEQLHKNGWIPCSEKLPEMGETVIACTSNGTFAGKLENEGWYRENMFFYDSEISVRDDVIAWQPLPEPYKGGSNNETD